MRRLRLKQSIVRRGTVVAVVALGIAYGFLVVPLVPTPSHAGHEGAADCPHQHINPAVSVCDDGVDGKKKCGEGKKGRCRQKTIELFDEPYPSCVCLTGKDELPPPVITQMAKATEVALAFPGVLAGLASVPTVPPGGVSGIYVACAQYNTAIADILSNKDALFGLMPFKTYHPRLLEQIDYVIANLQTIVNLGSVHSSTCSFAGVSLNILPSTTQIAVLTGLAQIKQAIIESRDLLIESGSTSP